MKIKTKKNDKKKKFSSKKRKFKMFHDISPSARLKPVGSDWSGSGRFGCSNTACLASAKFFFSLAKINSLSGLLLIKTASDNINCVFSWGQTASRRVRTTFVEVGRLVCYRTFDAALISDCVNKSKNSCAGVTPRINSFLVFPASTGLVLDPERQTALSYMWRSIL